ncbi:MAG: zf-TFIIB domain-containing protein [Ignavibacteriales bacterium]|nr:MAG: zf-TFIIB domain-containing protein [Ignavibacteriales bacterium]
MQCPACKDELIILELNKVEIDYCTNCSGIWLDAGELELLSGNQINDELEQHFRAAGGLKESARHCPICNKHMKKYFFGKSDDLVLDVCEYKHGIWFDNDELKRAVNLINSDSGNEISEFLNEIFNYSKK